MLISYEEALGRIANLKTEFATERCSLLNAINRVSAEAIYAQCDSPLFTNSAMDGYAFKFADVNNSASLRNRGAIHAGLANKHFDTYEAGACVKIMTGAMVPAWADTVVPVERTKLKDDLVEIVELPEQGAHIRRKAEDIAKGERIFAKHTFLDPERIQVLAQFGISDLEVLKQPKVHLILSGDELVEPGQQLQPGEIYNSSRYFLESALKMGYALEASSVSMLKDDPKVAAEHITKLLRSDGPELIITTGAVSAGDKDFIPSLAKDLGFSAIFHKAAIRPGKPVFLAQKANCLWLGLPGNPVSTAVGWQFFARPLLHYWANYPFPKRQKASILSDIAKPEGFTCFYRGTLTEGKIEVHQKQGSAHLLASLSANAYIILSPSNSLMKVGTIVDVQTI